MIEIGERVRIVERGSPAAGRTGTVIMVTRAGDGFLIETDLAFRVRVGRGPAVERRRLWCAEEELTGMGPADRLPVAAIAGRRSDPPADLAGARAGARIRAKSGGDPFPEQDSYKGMAA